MDASWRRAIYSVMFRAAIAGTLGGSAYWLSCTAPPPALRSDAHEPAPGRASGLSVLDIQAIEGCSPWIDDQ